MALSHEHVGSKITAKIKIYILTRAESLFNLCYEIPCIRVRPRFFDQVGHETMYASSGNKHFFTKSCNRQTYQNYEQPPRTPQNSYFQSL
jgi:capsule polysaccharide modification protein KpsS